MVFGAAGVLLALTVSVGIARAADMPVRPPVAPVVKGPMVPPFTWDGAYVGVHAGYARARVATDGDFDGERTTHHSRDSFAFGGAQIGYNKQSGSFVLGAEADIGYLGGRSSLLVGDHFTDFRMGWYGTLTGRLGFAWDRSLFYVKGGFAVADIRNTGADIDGGAFDPNNFSVLSGSRGGRVLGAGWEWAFAPSWSVKLEYLHFDLGNRSGADADGDTYSFRNRVQTFKIGLNYLFP